MKIGEGPCIKKDYEIMSVSSSKRKKVTKFKKSLIEPEIGNFIKFLDEHPMIKENEKNAEGKPVERELIIKKPQTEKKEEISPEKVEKPAEMSLDLSSSNLMSTSVILNTAPIRKSSAKIESNEFVVQVPSEIELSKELYFKMVEEDKTSSKGPQVLELYRQICNIQAKVMIGEQALKQILTRYANLDTLNTQLKKEIEELKKERDGLKRVTFCKGEYFNEC